MSSTDGGPVFGLWPPGACWHIPSGYLTETTTAATNPAITIGDLGPRTWRGHTTVSEDELKQIDFPYPPEPDWEDG